MRGAKSPSKYMSLEMLREIKGNYYRDKSGKDYNANEVDSMIWDKSSKKIEERHNIMMREREEEQQA